ncbi:transient receptor potential cation channel subfamily M member 7-like, partial [Montipora foliosa]|uniref:transient receptor potential cation channel subfamily M member 7-like n=1 Tax=Montipora foliosa TaxID=591990 RepID=UPI0035F19DFA
MVGGVSNKVHTITPGKGGSFSCDRTSVNSSTKICDHILAVAQLKGTLLEFIAWYNRYFTDMALARGQKTAGRKPRKRKRSNAKSQPVLQQIDLLQHSPDELLPEDLNSSESANAQNQTSLPCVSLQSNSHCGVDYLAVSVPQRDLEWAILVFLFGRLLAEGKQIADIRRSEDKKRKLKNYVKDRWNLFDLVIICMFFCGILPLRIVTWASSESGSNNQALEIAGYLYGFNTMLLTFRVFGSLLEAFEGVGTIQIALFQVIRDAVVVVVQFVVITVAFSSAITKVFVSSTGVQEDTKKYSWLGITSQLGLSLLDLSDGLDYFRSADSSSETLANWLFALYLLMTLIFLVNMLIALLSNTYQTVQDNSRREWAFQKAVRIQTYSNYHPIPVPFNIISMFLMLFPCLRMKKTREIELESEGEKRVRHEIMRDFKRQYRRRYGDSFPLTGALQQVAEETNNTGSMVVQFLHKTFTSDKALLPTGSEDWETHKSILVEGCLLTCRSNTSITCQGYFDLYGYNLCFGARYRSNFSPRFPHFEMMILESVEASSLTLGVVCESWDCKITPGFRGTVGFNTDLRIFDFSRLPGFGGKEVTGVERIRRGDIIRCTVMFEHEEETD